MSIPLFIQRHGLISISALALLTACGGSINNSNTLSGTVIDGYIEGAKVCLDVNKDGLCGAAEPTATTDAQGRYSLDITGLNASGLTLIAEIPDSAKDADDGGQTLAAAGKSGYTMATLADRPGVITPLTTLLVGKVQNGPLDVAQASAQVLAQLGLPSDTDLHADHVAKGNDLVQGTARQLAGRLQALQKDAQLDNVGKRLTALVDQDLTQGQVVGAPTTLANLPDSLAGADGQLLTYRMISAKGKPIVASALLFKPKSAAPAGGWPLVVFGHGTVGVARQCAPSVVLRSTGAWDYAPLVASLIAQGVAVVAPDYEGLGPADLGVPEGHPYLDLRSAGQAMVLAAVAAKNTLATDLSGAWAALGHSQGGHAALAAAQFAGLASQRSPGLRYLGAVAVAPASNLNLSLNTLWAGIVGAQVANYPAAYSATAIMNLYSAYLAKGSQSTPHPIDASTLFGTRMKAVYDAGVGSTCLDGFLQAIKDSIGEHAATAGATPSSYAGMMPAVINNSPRIGQLLAANEPGQIRLPGKTLLVQGSADATVLPSITQQLLATMKNKGSEVSLSLHEGNAATHSGVLAIPAAQLAIAGHLNQLFAPAP